MTASPLVSIVLPVRNEEQDIGRLLTDILGLDEPQRAYEVIVVDGCSTDRTRDVVQTFKHRCPAIRLLENPRLSSSSARNIGAQAARGEYVLFLDGHCRIPRKDYLVRLEEVFRSTGAVCLCRPQPLRNLAIGTWEQAIASARHSYLGHNIGSDIYGGSPSFTDPRSSGAAYVRQTIAELRGFDERFDACEDVEFNHRVAVAGMKSYRHPDLSVDYRPRGTLRALFRQMVRYGRGRARLMWRHPNTLRLTGGVLLLGVSLLVAASIVGALFFGWKAGVYIAGPLCGAWALVVLIESLRQKGVSWSLLRVAAAFLTIHSALLLGFWRGLLEFRRFRAPMVPSNWNKTRHPTGAPRPPFENSS